MSSIVCFFFEIRRKINKMRVVFWKFWKSIFSIIPQSSLTFSIKFAFCKEDILQLSRGPNNFCSHEIFFQKIEFTIFSYRRQIRENDKKKLYWFKEFLYKIPPTILWYLSPFARKIQILNIFVKKYLWAREWFFLHKTYLHEDLFWKIEFFNFSRERYKIS